MTRKEQLQSLERQLLFAQAQLSVSTLQKNGVIQQVTETRRDILNLRSNITQIESDLEKTRLSTCQLRQNELKQQEDIKNQVRVIKNMKQIYGKTGKDAIAAKKILRWYSSHHISTPLVSVSPTYVRYFPAVKGLVEFWKRKIREIKEDLVRQKETLTPLQGQAAKLCEFSGISPLSSAIQVITTHYYRVEASQTHFASLHLQQLEEIEQKQRKLREMVRHSRHSSKEFAGKLRERMEMRREEVKNWVKLIVRRQKQSKVSKRAIERSMEGLIKAIKQSKLLEILQSKGIQCQIAKEIHPESVQTADMETLLGVFRLMDDKIAQICRKKQEIGYGTGRNRRERVTIEPPSMEDPVKERKIKSVRERKVTRELER